MQPACWTPLLEHAVPEAAELQQRAFVHVARLYMQYATAMYVHTRAGRANALASRARAIPRGIFCLNALLDTGLPS
jgi:hypothetical protein